MKKVTLTGWRVGLKKISLTKLIIRPTEEALRSNLHGFVYTGDILEATDIEGEALIANILWLL